MTRDRAPTFPVELWANIMRYCPPETLKRLALVSHGCHEEARKYLYRSLYFAHGSRHNMRRSGTRICNLRMFRQSLSVWPGWRSAVQNVRLRWTTNGTPYCWKEPERFETVEELQLNELVKETANLLAESAVLKNLHLSIPRLDSLVPFGVDRLNSLDIPITDCLYNDPNFAKVLRLFQIPSLREVGLLQMLRLNCTVPEHCRQPGTSNVTSLRFVQCGPVSPEIAHLLSWPKDLQVLDFAIDLADGLNRYAFDSGSISFLNIRKALSPVEHCLQDLNVDIFDHGGGWLGAPLQDDGFRSFTKLSRLSVPLAMFMKFSDSDDAQTPDSYEYAPPLHTRLPPSIQVLVLKLDRDFWWGDWDSMQPSSETKQLVAYIAELARHKHFCFPQLSEVHISMGSHSSSTSRLPLELEHTQYLVEVLQSNGVAVYFP